MTGVGHERPERTAGAASGLPQNCGHALTWLAGLLMGWSGRAPAPPANEAGQGLACDRNRARVSARPMSCPGPHFQPPLKETLIVFWIVYRDGICPMMDPCVTYLQKRAGIVLTPHQFRHLSAKVVLQRRSQTDTGNRQTVSWPQRHQDHGRGLCRHRQPPGQLVGINTSSSKPLRTENASAPVKQCTAPGSLDTSLI